MNPLPFLTRARAKHRTLVYGCISLLVIGSMLLRPVMAIAVIHKVEHDLQAATAARFAPLDRTSVAAVHKGKRTEAMYVMDQLRIAAALPAPAMRTMAQVNPTPSNAKPAYPNNHILDSTYQAIGTPPANYDFESAATGGGVPPVNNDFSAASYGVGTPSPNHDFETGTFSNWTTAGTVSIQSDANHGYWAQLQSNGVITSEPFTVDSAAQRITVSVNHLSGAAIKVYLHSDPSYSTRTQVAYLYCTGCGWVDYSIDPGAYLGQSVKIEFLRYGSGTMGVDNVQMDVLLPDYTTAGSFGRVDDGNGNVYARLAGGDSVITSAPFTIGSGVQQLALLLSGLTTRSDQYRVQVLSGAGYTTVTQLGAGTVSDSWQQFSYNVSAWQGQSVKLRIASIYTLGTIGVDDIGVQSITIPGWAVTGATQVVDEGNGNHFVSTNGTLISDAFVLDPNVQQIALRYRGDDGAADTFFIKLLRGANFSEEVDLIGLQAAGATWQTLKIGLNLYAGETVKLKLARYFGRIYFDDAGGGEIILPGWQPTGTVGIAGGTDSHGSYVTAADGTALFIRSVPIEAGIIDHPYRDDRRYYAVAYDIGYVTGSQLQLFWTNEQGQQYTVFQDAADAPTGYRERYFPIPESIGTSGYFVVKATGGGKVYSIGDNIARQHLNEPFSYKVGIRIDTATGAFGYQAQDLQVAGNTPLVFTRYYNGHSDRLGVMGYGWSHSYETRLVVTDDDDAGVIFGAGKEIFFTWNGTSQTFTPADARIYDELVKNGDGSYTFTTKANQRYNFSATGLLTTVQDPNNNTVSLGYDGNGRLGTVTAQGGATLTLGYDGNGRLATVTNPLNATTTYSYDGNGDLISAARPDAGSEQYSYSSHRLSQVVDATGHTLFQNSFDSIHRVVQQSDALGKHLTIQYSTPAAGVTTVIDPKNGVSYYYFDKYQRTTDWVAPTGEITSYLYDNIGNLQAVIDGGAGQWDFAYDANGNLLSSTDPLGNPTLLTYNPEHLPTTMTDANGNVTNFTYDGLGNVTQITDALGGITYFVYNERGNLISKTDPLGHTETYNYDLAGNRLSRTDALGNTWQWTYDDANQLKTETDPKNHTTTYFYDLAGRMVAIRNHLNGQKNFLYDPAGHLLMAEDELGRRTQWDYDDRGLVEAKIDPAGKITTYVYDDNRNMTVMTDPLANTTTYVYDAGNRLIQMTKPGGATVHYEYDGNDKLAREINPSNQEIRYFYDDAGRLSYVYFGAGTDRSYGFVYDSNGNVTSKYDPWLTTTYTYDALNRLVAEADGLGTIATYSYDAASRRTAVANGANETTTFGYDIADRLTAVTDPLGHAVTFGYDAAGNRTTVVDPLNRSNSVVYDELNRPLTLIDAAGNQTHLLYDAVGQVTQMTASTGAITTFAYESRGLQTSITNHLGQAVTYLYDDAGRLSRQTDPLTQNIDYTYNAAGHLASVTNQLGKTTNYGYDVNGNVTSIADPLGRTKSLTYNQFNQLTMVTDPAGVNSWFEYDITGRMNGQGGPGGLIGYNYDDRGRVTSISDNLSRVTAYEYDNVGRRTKIIDPRNNQTLFAYDAAGRLTTMTDALGGTVQYAYDNANQLTAVANPNGKTTSYTYDLLGNLLTKSDPLNRTISFGYDQYGRRASTTDARLITVNYSYDMLDRVTAVTHPNGTDSYSYDAVGRLSTVTDPTGTTTYSYDPASRITAIAAPQGTVNYGYNDADQRTSMTLPGPRAVTYGYDGGGRLNSVTDWMGRATNVAYNGEGFISQITRPNGVSSDYTYELDGTLSHIEHQPNNMLYADYDFDGNNNRLAVDTLNGTEAYTFDALNRLTQVSYPNGDNASYAYDANGNRLSQTVNGATTNYTYDDAGQLLSDGATTYTYDANGNLVTAGADSYTWDWANRLTGASVNGQSAAYSYDATNVRVGANVNGVANSFLWDRTTALPLLVDDGTNAYLHGTGPMAQIDGAGTRYDLLADGLGSIRSVTDSSSALVGTADYGVFGDYRSQSGTTSRFGFTGEYFAPETGLWHLRARDLNPAVGRFISADPVQPNAPGSQGYNSYAYVANNPTTWVDPSGFSVQHDPMTPNQAAILVAMMVSVPAAVTLGGIGVGLMLLALVLACGVDENCRPTWQDANGMIKKLGSDGINTIQWTAEKLNQAFAKYPLLPEDSPALQVMAGLGLSVTGLDTVTDFAALISGRDPLTGRALTPRDMFITWLALSIPFVAASALHGFADDAAMLFKTGIWGGTIDDIAAALPPDVAMGVRPRPVAAGLWELTRLTSPKPVKSAAEELMKLKWGSIDTGLRLMKDRTGQRSFKLFLAHSDIDIQFIVENGGPLSAQMVDEFVAGVNSRLGRELFQHGDNFTGLTQWASGPTKAYQDAPTVIIGKPGYLGMGPGLNGFLGFLDPKWREAVLVFFSMPGVP